MQVLNVPGRDPICTPQQRCNRPGPTAHTCCAHTSCAGPPSCCPTLRCGRPFLTAASFTTHPLPTRSPARCDAGGRCLSSGCHRSSIHLPSLPSLPRAQRNSHSLMPQPWPPSCTQVSPSQGEQTWPYQLSDGIPQNCSTGGCTWPRPDVAGRQAGRRCSWPAWCCHIFATGIAAVDPPAPAHPSHRRRQLQRDRVVPRAVGDPPVERGRCAAAAHCLHGPGRQCL